MSTDLLAIDQALELILEQATPLAAEDVLAADADGRYLAQSVTALLDLPPFTNSAMDGYALRAADTPGALAVVGESAAGLPFPGTVTAGQAVTISTGAVLPDGADAVIPIEQVQRSGDPGATIIVPVVEPGANVRHRGGDLAVGSEVIAAGTRLGPPHLGAVISAGRAALRCARRPRVAILTTGDELRPPGSPLAPGQIYDSNGPMLAAALKRAGAEVSTVPAAADTPEATRAAFAAALEHDVVISTGGVSVGPHDLVRGVGAELGVRELFWRVKMRPGKPLSFGMRGDTLVFGLPGNPVSVLVCCEMFVAPALAALQGARHPRPNFARGTLTGPIRQNPERDDLIRVTRDAGGRLTPVAGQQSHQLATSARSDGLARIPTGTGELPAGSEVAYLPLFG
jgi:molybdopterin molybdotransferase